ncbi:(deoxy)nucleoside triphosphate pyrophosphohydrolase [Olsenella massiliensis]|uniref:(deoxy)nucleoside triphosphate pyrophosphohydrolase n=1 Tax=Olsenella massiliensis TaxID=1622075 RepID=UPI00071E1D80|nr:(deoxy)nucleoside triphosphate pyrophosphohydrolase [Olsenella massiliensis]
MCEPDERALPPDGGPQTLRVVAAVIFFQGRVLAGRRGDGRLAGGWEFPGGKVEPGESDLDALQREIREELACELTDPRPVYVVTFDYPDFRLYMPCFACGLAPGDAPRALVHTDLLWLSRDELWEPAWLPADRGLIAHLETHWEELRR